MNSSERLEIDCSFGEGGGQILRSSLSLSLVCQKSIRLFNIRAKRPKPGLRAQHLVCVLSASEISGSKTKGEERGSKELEFVPGRVQSGNYHFRIGTAGSTLLVFQTLLPALLFCEGFSELKIEGGTHNPKAPPFEFVKESFIPVISRLGIECELDLIRYGFYPQGGGAIKARIKPWVRRGGYLSLREPCDWKFLKGEILLSNLPMDIAEREQNELATRLGIEKEKIKIKFLSGETGPGNAILLYYSSGNRVSVLTGFGEKGKRAERVASELAREAKNFIRSGAGVDPYLADQLVLYLALGAGGEFTTNRISEHLRTNLKVIELFLKVKSEIETIEPDLHLVRVMKDF